MNRNYKILVSIVFTLFLGSNLSWAAPQCHDLFNAQLPAGVKALLPGADFVLSHKFEYTAEQAYNDDRFFDFTKKYPDMDPNDAVALYYYTESLSYRLNSTLAKKEYDPYMRQAQVYIDSALKHLPVVEKTALYRGLKREEIDILKKYKVGEVIEFQEYKSTSDSIQIADAFSTYHEDYSHIMVIKNAKAYDLIDISHYPDEREFLIKARSRFKLIDIELHEERGSKTKKYIVEMLD